MPNQGRKDLPSILAHCQQLVNQRSLTWLAQTSCAHMLDKFLLALFKPVKIEIVP
jgi:hypothetical protein